ncbi:MAG: hypothetical protein D6782_12500 [Alphaproteobacteria bacterium]|nr:MAG: hypothetical protein D6782_12500 [Alphaproteobacteria bacterium]
MSSPISLRFWKLLRYRRGRGEAAGGRWRPGGGRRCANAAVGSLLWLAGACSSSVDLAVQSSVPAPVVSPLPVRMGLYYDDSFQTWVHRESSEDREGWQIDIGAAQRNLFDTVVPLMFEEVHSVSALRASDTAPVDAIISPELVQVQIALPEETHTDFYEAWMKYRVGLYDPAGALITSWDIVGYGKVTKGGLFTSKEKWLNLAIDEALRTVGAELVLGFAARNDVRQWLCRTVKPLPAGCAEAESVEDKVEGAVEVGEAN